MAVKNRWDGVHSIGQFVPKSMTSRSQDATRDKSKTNVGDRLAQMLAAEFPPLWSERFWPILTASPIGIYFIYLFLVIRDRPLSWVDDLVPAGARDVPEEDYPERLRYYTEMYKWVYVACPVLLEAVGRLTVDARVYKAIAAGYTLVTLTSVGAIIAAAVRFSWSAAAIWALVFAVADLALFLAALFAVFTVRGHMFATLMGSMRSAATAAYLTESEIHTFGIKLVEAQLDLKNQSALLEFRTRRKSTTNIKVKTRGKPKGTDLEVIREEDEEEEEEPAEKEKVDSSRGRQAARIHLSSDTSSLPMRGNNIMFEIASERRSSSSDESAAWGRRNTARQTRVVAYNFMEDRKQCGIGAFAGILGIAWFIHCVRVVEGFTLTDGTEGVLKSVAGVLSAVAWFFAVVELARYNALASGRQHLNLAMVVRYETKLMANISRLLSGIQTDVSPGRADTYLDISTFGSEAALAAHRFRTIVKCSIWAVLCVCFHTWAAHVWGPSGDLTSWAADESASVHACAQLARRTTQDSVAGLAPLIMMLVYVLPSSVPPTLYTLQEQDHVAHLEDRPHHDSVRLSILVLMGSATVPSELLGRLARHGGAWWGNGDLQCDQFFAGHLLERAAPMPTAPGLVLLAAMFTISAQTRRVILSAHHLSQTMRALGYLEENLKKTKETGRSKPSLGYTQAVPNGS